MIFKSLPLSIVHDVVLICTQKMFKHRPPKREMRGNNLCKQNVRERDSCLQVVLCYKDAIYKGLYGNFTGLL